MEQVRLGIIGIGGMGTEHAKGLLAGKVPELKLTAVADIRPARLAAARRARAQRKTGRGLHPSGAGDE